MENDQIVTPSSPVEYEDTGPRYSESYLARVGRYNQIINRNSTNSSNKSTDLNDVSSDNDRVVIVAPTRDFVEEDDKEAENTLIPGRFCQPESPTVSNTEIGDSSTVTDVNFLTYDDIVVENHEIEVELKPPPTLQITLQRQNSEEIEKNFGGLGPIKNTQIIKENQSNQSRPRTSGWAKLFASTLQRSKSTVTSEMNQNNQKIIKLRPGRKSDQSVVSLNSSITSSSTPDSESSDTSNIKLEMRKKKRSIGVDMREKLNFFRKQQGENSSLSTSSSTTTNRSSLISPNFMINLDNVWRNTNGCPTREQVLSWSQSFENILYDQHGITLFLEFLRSEFSDENLEFWSECQAYRSIKCPKKLQEKATQIFEDYVAEQSPKEINLDSVTRIQTASDIVHATKQTFDQSQKKIQALMEKDSYQRFLRSEIFHNLMNQLNISPTLTGKLAQANSLPTEQQHPSRVSYIPGLLPKVTTVSKLNQTRTNTNPNLISSTNTSKSENSGDYGHHSAPSSPKNKTASDPS